MRSLLLAVVVLAPAVQAAPVLVPLSRGLELKTQSVADPATADLVVQSRALSARYGMRCVSGDAYGPRSPIVAGATCEVRDAAGAVYEVRVTNVGNVAISFDVRQTGTLAEGQKPSPFQALPPDLEPGVLARYRIATYAIDGNRVESHFASLVLHTDGGYQFGERRGRWSLVQGLLLLDGEYTAWGAGALSEDARRLTFHSGGAQFSVSAGLEWVDPKTVLVSQASR
jgi:hypothetical protein